jgi:arsenite methyltransferase
MRKSSVLLISGVLSTSNQASLSSDNLNRETTMNDSNLGSSCDRNPVEQVRLLYTELAVHPEKDFGWKTGKENAKSLGYDQAWLDRIPDVVWESSAGVGNPFVIGPIHAGETVVDLGCGAGVDLCIASLMVGASGEVVGIDITPAMVEKARSNAALMNLHNAQVHLGDILKLPLSDASVDVVISNGAINLSQHKPCVLREALRVLKPGGRLYVADMIRVDDKPTTQCESKDATQSWANCVAGTISRNCFEKLLADAGFNQVSFVGTTGYHTSPQTVGSLFRATKPVA